MKYVPNMLSLSRIPLAVAMFAFAITDNWGWAAVCMIAALITDGLDGAIARRYKVQSEFGGDFLEPICDFILAMYAVASLVIGGYWSFRTLMVLAVVALLLQVSHWTPFTWLKRHTFYIHPVFFVAVVSTAGFKLLLIAVSGAPGWVPVVAFLYWVVWLIIAYYKMDRWMVWFRGPQSASSVV